jgi:hypothetical protein
MPVILNDIYSGVEFDEEIRVQGFDYAEVVDLDDLRVERREDRTVVVLAPHLTDWIEGECAGEAILVSERDDFMIAFNSLADATLFRIRFAK